VERRLPMMVTNQLHKRLFHSVNNVFCPHLMTAAFENYKP
jgi:hypothetical protein